MKKLAAAVLTATAITLAVTGCSSNDDSGSSVPTTGNLLDQAGSAVNSAADSAKSAAQGAVSSAQSAAQGAISSAQSAGSSVKSRAAGAVDGVQAGTFVAAFRAGYPNLSQDRDDSSIEDVYAQTCAAIDDGVDESTIIAETKVRASNGATEATDEQAQQIYKIAKPLC